MEEVEGEVSVALAVEAGAVSVEVAAPSQPWDRAGPFFSPELELWMTLSDVKARLDEALSNVI